jgi:glycosyltransferase involved in cell wall biosynthesis
MNRTGWLVNDCLTCIPGTKTFWHNLLEWFPHLIDKTNGHTNYAYLAQVIESQIDISGPDYIIRNASYFPRIHRDVKTISLVQDVLSEKTTQLDVINHSTISVFNTAYVYNKYKSLIDPSVSIRICPLGIDFNFFIPIAERHPDVLPQSIVFIGAANDYPKGFNIMRMLINNMPEQNFCLIMKDDFSIHHLQEDVRHRVKIFNKVPSSTVRLLINSCILAVCTSYEETQHLSGIECGACNIPIVAREVGIYYDCKDDSQWGVIATDDTFIEKIAYVKDNLSKFYPREYLIKKYSTEVCKQNWINMIESL